MNIVEIIKKAPEDHVYYCTVLGYCNCRVSDDDEYSIKCDILSDADRGTMSSLTKDGKFFKDTPDSECVLFPSRGNRDWEAFERELEGTKDDDSRFNPPAYGTDSYKDGVFSGYCKMEDMIEINLDHEYYKEHPYINFQIDGKEYKVSTEDMKRLSMGNADNKTEHISGQSFDGTPKIVWDDNTKKIIKIAEKWQREIEKIEKHWKEVDPMIREMAQRINEMYKEYQRRNNHDTKTD